MKFQKETKRLFLRRNAANCKEVAELEETVRAQNALIVKLSAGRVQVAALVGGPPAPFLAEVFLIDEPLNSPG